MMANPRLLFIEDDPSLRDAVTVSLQLAGFEVHISALRRKLEAHGGRLIHTERGEGYVLRSPSPA